MSNYKSYMFISQIISPLSCIISVIVGSLLTYCLEFSKRKRENNEKLMKNIYFKIYTVIEHCYLSQNNFSKELYIGLAKCISVIELKNYIEKLMDDNFDIIDSRLFKVYHIIKTDQYFDDITGGLKNFKYLELFANLSLWMIKIMKKSKMADKEIIQRLDCLYYEYSVWFSLMERLMDWEQVQNILIKEMFFKRTFKSIKNSIFINKLYKNKNINTDEFVNLFEAYCCKKITFPIFNKHFWQ